jgi:hypothetical protein
MSKIRIEFECNGNTAVIFDQLIEDSRDLFKNDAEALEVYESIVYEIKDRPQLYVDQLLKIVSNDQEFASHIAEVTNDLDGATVDLIAAAYDLDGDEMSDESLLLTIKEILSKREEYLARNK